MLVNTAHFVRRTDIARMFGVSRAGVGNWMKRHEDFPQPVPGTHGLLFDRREVLVWAERHGKTPTSEENVS